MGRYPSPFKLYWDQEGKDCHLLIARDESGFMRGLVLHEAPNHVTWIAGIGMPDFQQGVERRVLEAKGYVQELYEENCISILESSQKNPTESPVMVGGVLASGVAPAPGDRKDVNASSFRKTEPVNNGEGAGKAEPVA